MRLNTFLIIFCILFLLPSCSSPELQNIIQEPTERLQINRAITGQQPVQKFCPDGNVPICKYGEAHCYKLGELSLFEQCTFDCLNGRCVSQDESRILGSCVEVLKGHNSLNENRVNVVFLGFDYPNYETYLEFVENSVDLPGTTYGLLAAEPFKSNKNSFNFWYVDKIQTSIENSQFSIPKISKTSSMFEHFCNLPNTYPIALVNQQFTSSAGETISIVSFPDKGLQGGALNCKEVDYTKDGCVNEADLMFVEANNINPPSSFMTCISMNTCNLDVNADLSTYRNSYAIVVHEFGHAFGNLLDEYNVPGRVHHQSGQSRDNCFTASSKQECISNAPWRDLIGQGCGSPSLDCSPEDKDYSMEIGCFEGCLGATKGIYRPTLLSIMGGQDQGKFNIFNTEYSFRLVNERLICKELKQHTGKVEGYCKKFSI